MLTIKQMIEETSSAIKARINEKVDVAIILGTGLGALAEEIDKKAVIPYKGLPHFPLSTVETHQGELVVGKLAGKKVVAMSGRFHRYEGYTMQQITFPVRVMRAMGARILVVSNAAGGINRVYKPGDLMIITDHINLMGDNPLIGSNDESLGTRYPDMSEPYDKKLLQLAEDIALKEKIRCHRGVYAAMTGPSLETAAEYRFLGIIGADAIGMSTVPEVIVAKHAGMRVLGISVITDSCIPDKLEPANISAIISIAEKAEPKLTSLMKFAIQHIKL